jgi:selenocysteine lyase/cysteine desulfurase
VEDTPARELCDRNEFPVLNTLTYLNTASTGLVPRPVIDRMQAFEADLAERGTTGFDEATEIGVLDAARTGAATLFNAPADNVGVTSSFTEALCQLAWWLKPGVGKNVVSTDLDFPSVTYPWHRLAEDTGLEVRLVPVSENPSAFTVEQLAEYVDDDTAAICISHVQYLTGHRIDLTEVAELAHAHAALAIIDATQSAGQVPIDVVASGVDALIAGSYKFLCSTFGAATCYLAPSLMEQFRPPFAGWRSATDPYSLDARYKPLASDGRILEFSTMSYAAAVALGGAFEYFIEMGVDEVAAHNLRLSTRLMRGLEERGAVLLTPEEPSLRAGTVTARFPGHDGEAVATALTKRGVIVSPRVASTRFSVHFYNVEADVDHALATLDDVLATA